MPELPEVETVVRGLADPLTGRKIRQVRLHRTDIVHGDPAGLECVRSCRISAVVRRGKQIQIDLCPPRSQGRAFRLVVHLGMTGRLFLIDPDRPVEKHTHLRMTFVGFKQELRFVDPRRFGGIWLTPAGVDSCRNWRGRQLPRCAAEPLSAKPAEFASMLQRRRQIKALLLDQQPLSGIGNIYADEMLHRAGIHPLASACDLGRPAVQRLFRAMKQVLREAIRAGGSSVSDYRNAENAPGFFQNKHRVYGRAGQPCRKCGTAIEKLVAAGRGTHICPNCQPRP